MPVKKAIKKKYEHYHKDGTLWAKGDIKDRKMDGRWEWFRRDGSPMRDGHFRAGKQIGKWTTYNRKGGVVKITDFDKQKLNKHL